MEYNLVTDRLVGFVLPCDDDGLPLNNTFIAVTFEAVQNHFQTGTLSRYVFAYMAQSVVIHLPAFCLCYIGTDNKFSNETVLNKRKYINKKFTTPAQLLVLHLVCQDTGIF